MKNISLIISVFLLSFFDAVAQTDSFDVFTYQAPKFFTKSVLPSRLQFNLTNSDTSFCNITVYKSQVANSGGSEMTRQWNEHVVKKLTKADKKPQQVLSGKQWDGWAHTLAIGNFYQNKKKCVVMLNSFTKDKVAACVVFVMSDKSFKEPVESFSKQLHLNNNE